MATVSERDLAKIALLRRLYEVFRGPDQTEIQELSEGNWVSDVQETLAILGLDQPEGWSDLLNYLGRRSATPDLMFEELSQEHTRLFINAYGGILAPPYGSIYLNSPSSSANKVTLQVAEWQKRAGVALPPDYPEPPDYLPVELEFLIHLIQSIPEAGTGEAAAELREVKEEFFEQHFTLWAPQFIQKVIIHSRNPLYKVAAEALESLITNEAI